MTWLKPGDRAHEVGGGLACLGGQTHTAAKEATELNQVIRRGNSGGCSLVRSPGGRTPGQPRSPRTQPSTVQAGCVPPLAEERTRRARDGNGTRNKEQCAKERWYTLDNPDGRLE